MADAGRGQLAYGHEQCERDLQVMVGRVCDSDARIAELEAQVAHYKCPDHDAEFQQMVRDNETAAARIAELEAAKAELLAAQDVQRQLDLQACQENAELRAEVDRTKEILRAQGVVISELRANVELRIRQAEALQAHGKTMDAVIGKRADKAESDRDALREEIERALPPVPCHNERTYVERIGELRAVGQKDYNGMREFQAKFIKADQQNAELRAKVERLNEERCLAELDQYRIKPHEGEAGELWREAYDNALAQIGRLEEGRAYDKKTWRGFEDNCYQNLGVEREHGYDLRARCTEIKADRDALRADRTKAEDDLAAVIDELDALRERLGAAEPVLQKVSVAHTVSEMVAAQMGVRAFLAEHDAEIKPWRQGHEEAWKEHDAEAGEGA